MSDKITESGTTQRDGGSVQRLVLLLSATGVVLSCGVGLGLVIGDRQHDAAPAKPSGEIMLWAADGPSGSHITMLYDWSSAVIIRGHEVHQFRYIEDAIRIAEEGEIVLIRPGEYSW